MYACRHTHMHVHVCVRVCNEYGNDPSLRPHEPSTPGTLAGSVGSILIPSRRREGGRGWGKRRRWTRQRKRRASGRGSGGGRQGQRETLQHAAPSGTDRLDLLGPGLPASRDPVSVSVTDTDTDTDTSAGAGGRGVWRCSRQARRGLGRGARCLVAAVSAAGHWRRVHARARCLHACVSQAVAADFRCVCVCVCVVVCLRVRACGCVCVGVCVFA